MGVERIPKQESAQKADPADVTFISVTVSIAAANIWNVPSVIT